MIIHGSFEIGQAVEMCKSKKVGFGLAKCFRVSLAMSQNASISFILCEVPGTKRKTAGHSSSAFPGLE